MIMVKEIKGIKDRQREKEGGDEGFCEQGAWDRGN